MLSQLIRALATSGLTQSQIAEKARVSQAQVSRILKGERGPSLNVAERLAKVIGKKLVLK